MGFKYHALTVTLFDARAGVVALNVPDYENAAFGIFDKSMKAEIEAQKPGAFRHNNGANYAFADGHAKWLPAKAFISHCDGKRPCFIP